MREPFDARHYSWRQYRALENMTEAGRTDDLHAYLPNFRRVRRLPGSGRQLGRHGHTPYGSRGPQGARLPPSLEP